MYSTELAASLVALGVRQNKTHRDDPLPPVPDEFLCHFARTGCLRFSGTVGNIGTCTSACAGRSRRMTNDIAEFCDRFGACHEGRVWALANCRDMADAWVKLQPEWLIWVAIRPEKQA